MFSTFRLIFSVLLLLFSSIAAGQNSCKCDSEKNKIELIHQLLNQKDYVIANKELTKININNINCKIEQLQLQSELFSLQAKFESADSCLALLKDLVYKSKCKTNQAKYHLQNGFLLMKKTKFDSAVPQLIKSQELASEENDLLGQYYALMNLATLLNKMQQSDKSIDYDRKALVIARSLNDVNREVRILSNMQGHFGVWYDITQDLKYIDSLKKTSALTIKLSKKFKLRTETAQCYSVLAGISFIEDEFKTMLLYTDSALMFLDRNRDHRFCMSVFLKKCDAYIELKNYNIAKTFGDSALIHARLENDILSIANTYERLYEVEKLRNNFSASLFYHENYTKIRDSIRNVDKFKVINDIEQKYNKVENEKQINKLAFEKDILNKGKEIDSLRLKSLIGIVVAIAFVLIAVVFFYRQSVIKSKLQKMETEQRLNRARMNPHFFFNVLASIQTMILEEEDAGKSAIMISKFSKIMRQSLESTYNELIPIEDEIEFITSYLDIQQMRYDNKFSYTITVSDDIDTDRVNIPSMLLQPFVENSIEHGFKDLKTEGILEIKFETENNKIKISCNDNGKGFNPGSKHKGYPSRATQIINDRLYLLNKQYKTDGHFELTTHENKGTQVVIFLPIINQE
ncbi:MAG: histidine kinase [Bacteroidetes bacterium]|nr:histidine kinase [Bacteroidota bacterium]